MAERKMVARSGAKTAVWRAMANGRRLRHGFILAVLCCMILPLPAAAQWVAADLFPEPPVPAAAGPHGNSALEGMVDISPVARGLGRLRLQLPGGSTVEMARDGFERRGDGDVTWRGKINGDEGSQVILTAKDGYIAGTILDGLDEYRIRPGPGRSHIIEQVDAGEQPADEHIAPPIDYSYDVEPVYDPSPFPPDPYGNSPDNIQLLVVYTAPARIAAGGEGQIEVLIQSMVDQANAAFANSGMIARLSLVRTEEIPYSESSDVAFDLNYIVNDADAFLIRHEYGADLVSLVVDNGGACASAAYIMTLVDPEFAPYGFSVVSLNCGAGTLAHEVGHNLGFEHNPEDSIRYVPGGSYSSATPYSFGHYVDGSFRTIMSYATPCALGCPKALHFSNPVIDFLGSPTGIVDERDNALSGSYSAPVVADFYNELTGALVNRRIAATADDVEELAAGTVVFDSTTLELGDGLAGADAVGLRFQNIHIPPGALVDSAFLEFEAAETGSDPASLQISAEATDNALPFSATAFDVTGRAATAAWVQWDLPAWDTLTEKHFSPDLSAVIQEVVDRPGWAENNSMVLLLNGTGLRTALSYDGDPAGAPLLHVEYSIIHPKAAYSYECTGLTCSFTDESEGNITMWNWYFYDSGSWWFDSQDQNVTVTFPADGTYTLEFAVANDAEYDVLTEQITVSGGNTPPVASDDAYVTAVDTPVSGNVLTDGTPDSDVNGDTLTVSANSSPSNGSATVAANGDFTYTPAAGYIGTDSFTYTVDDGNGGSDTGTVTITVRTNVVATENSYTTAEDTPIGGNVLTDGTPDSDFDGDPLIVAANSDPVSGTVSLAADGSFTYTPDPDFWGSDSFTYTAADGTGNSATATVNISISAVNDPPVVSFTYDCSGLNCGFAGTKTDVDSITNFSVVWDMGDGAAYNRSTVGTIGHSYPGDGTYTVTLTVTDFGGATGTATQTVTVANNPPVAYDKSYQTWYVSLGGNMVSGAISGGSGTVKYSPGDSDPDGDALTVLSNTNTTSGVLTLWDATGNFEYRPDAGFYGYDSFTYTISDGHGATATATVNVEVNAPPNADFIANCSGRTCNFTDTSLDHLGPISQWAWSFGDGTVSTEQNPSHTYDAPDSYTVTLVVTDVLGDTSTETQPVWAPNLGPEPNDDSYVTSEDSAVTGNVLTDGTPDSDPDGDALVVIGNSDPSNGMVSVAANGDFTYTPNANYSGADSFTYMVSDVYNYLGSATVFITVTPVNDAPAAAFSQNCSGLNCAFTDSSSDPLDSDGSIASWSWAFGDGAVSMEQNPIHSYAADGTYTVNLTVTDNEGATDTVSQTVTVANSAPVANDDAYATDEDVALSGNVLTDGAPDSDADGDTLTVTSNTAPANGTVTVAANGVFSYTPDPNFNGSDSFTYTVGDGAGGSDMATVSITVNSVNDAPVAIDDSYSTDEDVAVAGNVMTDGTPDSDVDGDPLTVTGNTAPTNGSVAVAANGAFTYTPNPEFNGSDSFTYTVDDGAGGSDIATVSITVNPVNDVPVASDDVYTTDEDVALSGNVLTNGTPDSDADGDALTVTGNTSPANGTVSVAANGAFTYTPSPDFNGSDSFTYTIGDGAGGSDTATVSITVNAVNDPPVAAFSYGCSGVNCAFTDGSSDPLDSGGSIVSWSWVLGDGTTSTEQNPIHSYAADGTYTVNLTVTDNEGATDSTSQTVTVANTAPVATANSYVTDEDAAIGGNVLTDGTPDSDADGDALTVTGNTSPTNGSVIVAANGVFSYAPDPDFNGSDSFTYTVGDGAGGSDMATVSITVNPVNDPPAATFSYVCSGVNCTFADSSSDPLDSGGSIASWSWAFGDGAMSTAQNPTHSYAADGAYTVTLTATDNEGATDTASQTVTVANTAPVASDDTYTTDEDAAVSGNVLTDGTPDSDADGDALTVTGNTSPANGTVSVAANGAFTYTPDPEFNGSDSFIYTVGDGAGGSDTATVSITVNPVNDAPVASDDGYTTDEDVALSGNVLTDGTPDSDADGDTLSVTGNTSPANGTVSVAANGSFSYTPDLDFNGSDSFAYTVGDGAGGSDTATVSITVNPVNDVPVASDDAYTTDEDVALSGNVLTDGTPDSDADGDTLAVTGNAAPANGTVSVAANGDFTYTPSLDFNGSDSFAYTVDDGAGGSDTATVSITINPVNDAPVASDDAYTTDEDVALSGNVLTDGWPDSDLDGDVLTVTGNTSPANGTVSVAANGEFTYTPDPDFNGSDSFTYMVGDGAGGSDTATVSIAVNAVNDAPVATANAYTTPKNTDVSGNVLTDGTPDSDVDGDRLTAGLNTAPSNGTASVAADGVFTYTPNRGFSGNDSFTYLVEDGNGGTDAATVDVTVEGNCPAGRCAVQASSKQYDGPSSFD